MLEGENGTAGDPRGSAAGERFRDHGESTPKGGVNPWPLAPQSPLKTLAFPSLSNPFPTLSNPFPNLVPKFISFLDGFFWKSGAILGPHFQRKSQESLENQVLKAIAFWISFLDGFWMGFSWKIHVFGKAAEPILYYKNSGFGVFIGIVTKTVPGPFGKRFGPPKWRLMGSKNLV